ncbi:MAG: IS701 family transposase, partial [Anaerolineales bacterium]
LEAHRLHVGMSWFEAKTSIIRSAISQYLAHPTITLQPTA